MRGMGDLDDLHFVELVKAVQSADILAVGTRLSPETGGIGHILHREVLAFEDGVAVDVGHRHLSRGNQVKIVDYGVVHLAVLIGELAGAESRIGIHQIGGLNFCVARFQGFIEEEIDKSAL